MNLPEEDWICNLCLVYPEKELNNVCCILCSIQGGAMKLSSVKKSSAFYKKIERLRGNTSSESLGYSNTFRILNDKNNIEIASRSSSNKVSLSNKISKFNDEKLEKGKMVISIDNSNFDIGNEFLSRQSTEKTAVQRFSSMDVEVEDYNETQKQIDSEIDNDNENNEDCTEETFKLEFADNEIKEKNKSSEVSDSKKNGKGKGIKDLSRTIKHNKKNRKKQLKSLNPSSRALEIYKTDLLKKCNEYAWVHVSCALWNPFVQINDFENKEDIKSNTKN